MTDPMVPPKIFIPTTRYLTIIIAGHYMVIDPKTGEIVREGEIPVRVKENVDVLVKATDGLTATKGLAAFADVNAGLAKVASKSIKVIANEIEKTT